MLCLCAWLPVALSAGCARYTALPLPQGPMLAPDVRALDHRDVPIDGRLGVEQVAALALRNAPDIVSARPQRDVAEAQRRGAALPPNPQIAAAFLPLLAGIGTTPAYSVAITQDIKALITLPARRRAARAAAEQVSAQLLWQAWQTVGQARLLAVDLIEGERRLDLLRRSYDVFAELAAASRSAMRQGNATLATLAPDLAAEEGARDTLDDLVRQQQQRRHQLNALLGLAPDAVVTLSATAELPPIDPGGVLRSLPSLASRRPDLVALQLGYRAENERLRAAILSQFPNLTLGAAVSSDNSNIRNLGPQIGADLPIFDRNQAGVALERATRAQLAAEYAARLNAADGLVRASLAELRVQDAQLDQLRRDQPRLDQAATDATAAYRAADIDGRSYVDLLTAKLARAQQIVTVEQARLDSLAALATLTGADLPTLDLSGAPR